VLTVILTLGMVLNIYAYNQKDIDKLRKTYGLSMGDLSYFKLKHERIKWLDNVDVTGTGFLETNFCGKVIPYEKRIDYIYLENLFINPSPVLPTATNFTGSVFDNAVISNCNIPGSIFKQTKITNTTISDTKLQGADFTDADFNFVIVESGDFTKANFKNANIDMLKLHKNPVSFENTSFENATIVRTVIKNSNMKNVSFKNAKITNSSFEGSDLTGADLQGAEFRAVEMPDGKSYSGMGEDYHGHLKPHNK